VNLETAVVFIGILVFVAVFSSGCAMFSRALNLRQRVREAAVQESQGWRAYAERIIRAFAPLGEAIPRSPEDMSRLEQRMAEAGIRRRDSSIVFVGIQASAVATLLLLFAALQLLSHHFFFFVVLALFLGACLPDLFLRLMISRRKERIQLGLPDALDLTVICVEAGLGLDQSLLRIGQEIRVPHPDLSDELRLTNLEINMGRSRADALRNLGRRTGVDDLKALCAVLIQTDRFGTSIGQALRVFSDSLRVKRRQRAEERAAKLPVKMMPPLVVFIFPSVFVPVVGPAVIAIIRDLLPAMNGR
jgi:tight adherence protein C